MLRRGRAIASQQGGKAVSTWLMLVAADAALRLAGFRWSFPLLNKPGS
jgi:hypothetical protein